MEKRMPLPVRGPRKTYLIKFSELVTKSDAEILDNRVYVLFIDDTNLLVNNFDKFLKILSLRRYEKVYSKDYEALKFIEDNLKDKCNIILGLLDDFENKDRSYIDGTYFSKTSFAMPFVYSMWNPNIGKSQLVSAYYDKEILSPMIINGFSEVTSDFIKKVKEIVDELSKKYGNCTDEEKVILISNYIQKYVQFVDEDNKSEGQKGIYITDSNGIVVNRNVHSPETVLMNHFGVCEGIGNATTMLLNNPVFNMNVRSVFGSSHVWNVVLIDGKYYYVDNTWSITRNEDQYPESLKARSFESKYLLFGSKTADELGHHISSVCMPGVEESDYPQEKLKAIQRKLVKKESFDKYNKPVFKSKLQ